jgi:hypothetical protein
MLKVIDVLVISYQLSVLIVIETKQHFNLHSESARSCVKRPASGASFNRLGRLSYLVSNISFSVDQRNESF